MTERLHPHVAQKWWKQNSNYIIFIRRKNNPDIGPVKTLPLQNNSSLAVVKNINGTPFPLSGPGTRAKIHEAQKIRKKAELQVPPPTPYLTLWSTDVPARNTFIIMEVIFCDSHK